MSIQVKCNIQSYEELKITADKLLSSLLQEFSLLSPSLVPLRVLVGAHLLRHFDHLSWPHWLVGLHPEFWLALQMVEESAFYSRKGHK